MIDDEVKARRLARVLIQIFFYDLVHNIHFCK